MKRQYQIYMTITVNADSEEQIERLCDRLVASMGDLARDLRKGSEYQLPEEGWVDVTFEDVGKTVTSQTVRLIGEGELPPDRVLNSLRSQGWTDEQIAAVYGRKEEGSGDQG